MQHVVGVGSPATVNISVLLSGTFFCSPRGRIGFVAENNVPDNKSGMRKEKLRKKSFQGILFFYIEIKMI